MPRPRKSVGLIDCFFMETERFIDLCNIEKHRSKGRFHCLMRSIETSRFSLKYFFMLPNIEKSVHNHTKLNTQR